MKACKNLDCVNNNGGYCTKESNAVNTTVLRKEVYDFLSDEQWIQLRRRQEARRKNGLKPRKKCLNINCISNIEGSCYLPSEIMALSVLQDKQWDGLLGAV